MTDDITTGSNPIEGLVAGILTERELVINVGSDQGVKLGTTFAVLANKPTEVTDPATNEVLGTLVREKVRVRAMDVKPRFTVCRTYRVHTILGGPLYYTGLSGQFRKMREPPRKIPETLKAEDADYFEDLPEEESFVKKGDHVIQIVEED